MVKTKLALGLVVVAAAAVVGHKLWPRKLVRQPSAPAQRNNAGASTGIVPNDIKNWDAWI